MPEKKDYTSCPSCPDLKAKVEHIPEMMKKLDRIDLALLGDDGTGMKNGIVKSITDLQKSGGVQSSWVNTVKPIAVAVATSIFTFIVTYGLLHFGV